MILVKIILYQPRLTNLINCEKKLNFFIFLTLLIHYIIIFTFFIIIIVKIIIKITLFIYKCSTSCIYININHDISHLTITRKRL